MKWGSGWISWKESETDRFAVFVHRKGPLTFSPERAAQILKQAAVPQKTVHDHIAW